MATNGYQRLKERHEIVTSEFQRLSDEYEALAQEVKAYRAAYKSDAMFMFGVSLLAMIIILISLFI
jgi:vacuolar-type H+-ATPase subunit D/Vma8